MATIVNISTQKNTNGSAEKFNFRTPKDIETYTHFVMKGSRKCGSPVYSSSRGFLCSKNDPKGIAEEMQQVQRLYNRTRGIRIRGEDIIVSKSELGHDCMNGVKQVAEAFSDYYMGLGHQVAYGIFDNGTDYRIRYAINTTNFADGSKYRHNYHYKEAEEFRCLDTIMADISGQSISKEDQFDFEGQEYHL